MPELKASTIDDITADLGIERVNILKNEETFIVQFGPLSHRQTVQLSVWATDDDVRAKFELAKGQTIPEAPSPVQQAEAPSAAIPATGKGKRKKAANASP